MQYPTRLPVARLPQAAAAAGAASLRDKSATSTTARRRCSSTCNKRSLHLGEATSGRQRKRQRQGQELPGRGRRRPASLWALSPDSSLRRGSHWFMHRRCRVSDFRVFLAAGGDGVGWRFWCTGTGDNGSCHLSCISEYLVSACCNNDAVRERARYSVKGFRDARKHIHLDKISRFLEMELEMEEGCSNGFTI